MVKRKAGSMPAELRSYLKRHPGTDAMELLITDVPGVFRCKRIRGQEFSKVFSDGFCMPGGTVLLNTLGDTVPGLAWSSDDASISVDPSSRISFAFLVPMIQGSTMQTMPLPKRTSGAPNRQFSAAIVISQTAEISRELPRQ